MQNISPYMLNDNVFRLIDKDWMLVTSGDIDHFNTMTASWGAFGILWHKPVLFIFVRPTRYTFQFLEQNTHFTCSFFGPGHRKALNICGSVSGRDHDKIKATGLTPDITPSGNIFFSQARLVIECRKIYYHDIDPNHFLDPAIDSNYPLKDFHRQYIGLIENCWLIGPPGQDI